MSKFWFYAYTIGARWGNNGVECKSLDEARKVAAGFAGDCMRACVSVSASIGEGPDYKIETLLVERYTPAGFVPCEA